MEHQGGGDRYGAMDISEASVDKPREATAAQIAKRKILHPKGRTSARSSRQNSPMNPMPANPFQSFTPPPSADTFNFSVPNNAPTAPSFGQNNASSFGKTSDQAQNNGAAPASFSFGNTNLASGFSFGQQPQASAAPTFSWGKPAESAGESFSASTSGNSIFSGTNAGVGTAQAPFGSQENLFSKGTTEAAKPSFSFGISQDPQATPKATFGSAFAPNTVETSKPSLSFMSSSDKPTFGGFGKTNTEQTNSSFGQVKEKETESSKPALSFLNNASGSFGKSSAEQGSNLFSQSSLTNDTEPPRLSFLGGADKPFGDTAVDQTLKDTNIFKPVFGQTVEKAQPEQPKENPPLFSFGSGTHPVPNSFGGLGQNMAADDARPVSSNASANTEPVGAEDINPNAGKSLFERITGQLPAQAPTPSNESVKDSPVKPMFGAAAMTNPITGNNIFTPAKPDAANSSNLFANSFSQPAASPASGTDLSKGSLSSSKQKLTMLNLGFVAHLQDEDPGGDWSIICQYYMEKAAEIMGENAYVPKAKPQPGSGDSLVKQPTFGESLAAEPILNNRKRALKEDAPETEKRKKQNDLIEYPKLPETSSKTAQLFASTLDSKSFSPSADVNARVQQQKNGKEATDKSTNLFSSSSSTTNGSTSTPFKPQSTVTESFAAPTSTNSSTAAAPTFGFKPTLAPASAGFKPNIGTNDASNFLASFGQQSEKELEKKRKERMEEDFDSDEEDKAQWEARYKEEQEAKRKQIEEAAKSGPTFKAFGSFTPVKSSVSKLTETNTPALSGVSTPGDGSDTEAEAPEEQIEDMTALLPRELEEEDVLLQLNIAKAQKFIKKDTSSWVEKGKGPLYVLKNKTSGKIRVLLKIPPMGRAPVNFPPLSNGEYKADKKRVMGPFLDHMDTTSSQPNVPSMWTINVKEASDAQAIADLLNKHK
ncbi:hypothetical protein K470DRAFT_273332 [Piedraia hortae CBS 480.64]|uniref:RanBD1 domain-containing protein n=1 Tax=Piedraia hortae CBS 480.64 TaxID=1314780 RepID=A0A6A7BQ36_9PEZI|nr:hypothetical protein K470DRAFT_273332 [Piedraia hortae CBS 480.64]